MLRMASYRIHQSLVQKPLRIKDYWPLPTDNDEKDNVRYVVDNDMLERINKAHGTNFKVK